jgi:hypothetical protein
MILVVEEAHKAQPRVISKSLRLHHTLVSTEPAVISSEKVT